MTALFAFLLAIFLSLAMMAACWIALKSGRFGIIDSIWTLATGAACGAAAIMGAATWPRAAIVVASMSVWAIRLGYYLWRRSTYSNDPRYAALNKQWGADGPKKLFLFLQAQAIASWPLAISAYVAAASPRHSLDYRDVLGLIVFITALGGEMMADAELAAFKANPANKGGVCEIGLWAWSRHPNYFFEWFMWLGLPLLGTDPHFPLGWLALIAPAEMYGLLVYVSGVPPLERAMRSSRGRAWDDYCTRVSVFWLLPPKRG